MGLQQLILKKPALTKPHVPVLPTNDSDFVMSTHLFLLLVSTKASAFEMEHAENLGQLEVTSMYRTQWHLHLHNMNTIWENQNENITKKS